MPKWSLSAVIWRWGPIAAMMGLALLLFYGTGGKTRFDLIVVFSWLGSLLLAYQVVWCWRRFGKWAGAFAIVRMLFGVSFAALITLMWMMAGAFVNALFGESEDHFADNLTIPAGIEISEPLDEDASTSSPVSDPTGAAWLARISQKKPNPPGVTSIVPSVPSLHEFSGPNRDRLIQHLSASAAWKVFRERGRLFATRRQVIGGAWQWTLNGYYSSFALGSNEDDKSPFSLRVTLGLDGEPWAKGDNTVAAESGSKPITLVGRPRDGGIGDNSHLVINGGGAFLEIAEERPGPERVVTPLIIADVERELRAVLDSEVSKRGALDRSLLPEGSTRSGSAEIVLLNGMQPGIYRVVAWANPGSAGTVFLKAFEISKGTRLSEERLHESSNARIGWSNDPNELFRYGSEVTIYEGDWEKPYAARFELWFQPDDGSAERELVQRNFKIEGWMR